MKQLEERSDNEKEEREKRQKEEEENKFDFTHFLLGDKKKGKPTTKVKKGQGGSTTTGAKGSGGQGRLSTGPNQQMNDKKPTKRNGMTKR